METEIVESGTDLDDGKSLEVVTGTGDFCLQTRGGENLWMCWQTLTGMASHLSSQSRGLIRAKALVLRPVGPSVFVLDLLAEAVVEQA